MIFLQIAQQEPWFFYVFVAWLGFCIGSFLNVVVFRVPVMLQRSWENEAKMFLGLDGGDKSTRFNLLTPGSSCPQCSSSIKPWHNIPVISYFLLKGRCANCHASISARYPIVELVTGILSVLVVMQFGISWQCVAMLLLTYMCIALAGIDYDTQLLPDNMVLPLLWLGLLVNSQGLFVGLHDAVFGAAAGYLVLWSIFWLFKLVTGKEGMGYGDFKLMAAFGAWFGWAVLPNIILLSSVTGAVLGVLMMSFGKIQSGKPIAFGPFIILAGWLTAMYPEYVTLIN